MPDAEVTEGNTSTRARWERAFLAVLRESGNITKSAKAAGVRREVVWKRRQSHPEFEALYQAALEESADLLEAEARRRAAEGLRRKKFTKAGEPIIDPETGEQYEELEYSDTLLSLLLRANRPEKFRERSTVELTGKGGGPVSIQYVNDWRGIDIGGQDDTAALPAPGAAESPD